MEDSSKLVQQEIADLRDMARRARRLASKMTEPDADRLRRYGAELDTQAAELAAKSEPSAASRTVTYEQQQAQQQSVDKTVPPDPNPKEPR